MTKERLREYSRAIKASVEQCEPHLNKKANFKFADCYRILNLACEFMKSYNLKIKDIKWEVIPEED